MGTGAILLCFSTRWVCLLMVDIADEYVLTAFDYKDGVGYTPLA